MDAVPAVTNPMPTAPSVTVGGTLLGSILHKQCHKWGNSHVWAGNGIQLWASGVWHGMAPLANGLHINLGPQEWGILGQYYTDPHNILGLPKTKTTQHELLLAWDDFSVPTLQASFWRLLARRIVEVRLPVLVFCQGGHGRTGTALAILLGLWGVKQPMQYVRDHYCTEAGESVAQIRYLDSILTKCGFSGQVDKKTYDSTEWTSPVGGMPGGYGYGSIYTTGGSHMAAQTPSEKEEEDAWWEERYGQMYVECSDGVWRKREQITQDQQEDQK